MPARTHLAVDGMWLNPLREWLIFRDFDMICRSDFGPRVIGYTTLAVYTNVLGFILTSRNLIIKAHANVCKRQQSLHQGAWNCNAKDIGFLFFGGEDSLSHKYLYSKIYLFHFRSVRASGPSLAMCLGLCKSVSRMATNRFFEPSLRLEKSMSDSQHIFFCWKWQQQPRTDHVAKSKAWP
jgi:hypothetical protein